MGKNTRLTLDNAEAEAHRRAASTVRFLLSQTGMSQQRLADLLGCDKSGINRALLDPGHPRQRGWRHGEIMTMSIFFEVDPGVFYSTDVERVWQEGLAARQKNVKGKLTRPEGI